MGAIKYLPEMLAIFSQQIVPSLEQMLLQKPQSSSMHGLRQMKCAILMIDHLQIGF